ncbi:MAG: prefoldin subunit beta [Candidatus Woesearchaeota archaeon]|jgi:prefoldin beta subunit
MANSKISQLQLLQQNLQNILAQKQQLQSQIVEYDSALTELKTTDKAYKIVGKIMLSASKEDIIKDLEDKKEVVEIRLKNFSQQEEKLQESFQQVQQEVMAELQQDKKNEKKK